LTLRAYLRLMRFHKPAGIALLWFPTAWALWLACHGFPGWKLMVYFLFGTVFMRAAGCVVNDIADRHVDKHVQRTCMRPITSGDVTVLEALGLLFVLLFLSFCVLVQLPANCFYYALFALCITIVYPFCKRFFQAPQLILGVAFSMGIPMAYVASHTPFDGSMAILLGLNFIWIVAYDTMYAMADRDDDLRIGVQSTAVLFADYDWKIVLVMQVGFHGLWLLLGWIQQVSFGFYVLWSAAAGVLVYQQTLLRTRDRSLCLRAFSTNSLYGLLMWLALVV
jgi:4-hydroxybenzoate polyprenyltransferase